MSQENPEVNNLPICEHSIPSQKIPMNALKTMEVVNSSADMMLAIEFKIIHDPNDKLLPLRCIG